MWRASVGDVVGSAHGWAVWSELILDRLASSRPSRYVVFVNLRFDTFFDTLGC